MQLNFYILRNLEYSLPDHSTSTKYTLMKIEESALAKVGLTWPGHGVSGMRRAAEIRMYC